MKTYQDFMAVNDVVKAIQMAINDWRGGETYKMACIANEYEDQRNTTITQYTKYLYDMQGRQIIDRFSSNNRIASNFFHRLNTQRCSYSLGNGVSFAGDAKDKMGYQFDNRIYRLGYLALIHGVSFGFWNKDQLYVFPATEFCPLWDEYDGTLKAGIRFWSLDWENKPVTAVLYEEDGYTVYRTKDGSKGLDLAVYEEKQAYVQNYLQSEADGEWIAGEFNYGTLPIIPMWGSTHRQSTLVGMRDAIDSYDLIQSGFANDLQDCAQIYWLIGGNFGMSEDETARFMDRLKLQHVANADTENSSVTPYTQEIPTQARETYLERIRDQIYGDFGALDVTSIAAGQKTATEIESAYEPMDEEADDFEYQVIEFIQQLLKLVGIEDTPVFKRNRIANQKEQTEMIMSAVELLDVQTALSKLPFITKDEVLEIMKRRDAENIANMPDMEELQNAINEETDE